MKEGERQGTVVPDGNSVSSLAPDSPLISVIVPVHGISGDLLAECLDSLGKQTLAQLEVLLVLDGPDEGTRSLLERWVAADSRMKLLQLPENRGVSAARNMGLGAVHGDWFAFVDADDRVEPEMFRELLRGALKSHSSLAGCGWRHEPPQPGEISSSIGAESAETLDFERPEDWVRATGLLRNGSCWGRLFSRRELGDLRFDETLRHGEDLVFLQEALGRVHRMAWIPCPLYIYRVRGGSASRKLMSADSFVNWLGALERRLILARSCPQMPELARLVLVWDTWFAVNDPRPRKTWPAEERCRVWRALRHFADLVAGDFCSLPPDIRAVWRRETISEHAFFNRPCWLNAWLWRRAKKSMERLLSVHAGIAPKLVSSRSPRSSGFTQGRRLYSAAPWATRSGAPLCALDHLVYLAPDFEGTLVLCDEGKLEHIAKENGVAVWKSQIFTGARHGDVVSRVKNLCRVPWRRIRYVQRLTRLLRKRPGILHIHSRADYLPYALLAGRMAGVPVVMTLHESWRGGLVGWWHLLLMRLFRVPVVCLTKTMVAEYPGLLKAAAVIPNAVTAKPAEVPQEGKDDGMPVVGMVATMIHEKGIDVCLSTCRILADRGMVFKLRLVGPWPRQEVRRESEEFIALHGLAEHVEIAGELGTPEQIYGGMDILFLPTRRDSFPRVVMEAMARGIPAVAARVDGIPEMVVDGETGFLVESGDTEGFAAVLERLLNDKPLREKTGRAARMRADALYSPKAYRKRFTEFYSSLPPVANLPSVSLPTANGTGRGNDSGRRDLP